MQRQFSLVMVVNALGAIFLAVGFLAAMLGVGLMYYSVEDEQRNDGWFFQDNQRTDDNIQRYNAGRIISVLGLVVFLTGAVVSGTRQNGD